MTLEELIERDKKQGMTLAEVLIAIVALGIVAALVIPALIAKKDRREWISALNKSYTTLANGFKNSEAINGKVERWTEEKFLKNFLEGFKLLETCDNNDCVPDEYYLNGEEVTLPENSHSYILADGQIMTVKVVDVNCQSYLGNLSGVCGYLYLDVNGETRPNTWGKDYFGFYITTEGIIPFGTQKIDVVKDGYEWVSQGCHNDQVVCAEGKLFSCKNVTKEETACATCGGHWTVYSQDAYSTPNYSHQVTTYKINGSVATSYKTNYTLEGYYVASYKPTYTPSGYRDTYSTDGYSVSTYATNYTPSTYRDTYSTDGYSVSTYNTNYTPSGYTNVYATNGTSVATYKTNYTPSGYAHTYTTNGYSVATYKTNYTPSGYAHTYTTNGYSVATYKTNYTPSGYAHTYTPNGYSVETYKTNYTPSGYADTYTTNGYSVATYTTYYYSSSYTIIGGYYTCSRYAYGGGCTGYALVGATYTPVYRLGYKENTYRLNYKISGSTITGYKVASYSPNTYRLNYKVLGSAATGYKIASYSPNTYQMNYKLTGSAVTGYKVGSYSPNTYQMNYKLTGSEVTGYKVGSYSPNTYRLNYKVSGSEVTAYKIGSYSPSTYRLNYKVSGSEVTGYKVQSYVPNTYAPSYKIQSYSPVAYAHTYTIDKSAHDYISSYTYHKSIYETTCPGAATDSVCLGYKYTQVWDCWHDGDDAPFDDDCNSNGKASKVSCKTQLKDLDALKDCNVDDRGTSCAAWTVINGNMIYLDAKEVSW
jgi:prepilin-type N-terminal cleavage/methylation domain-containing protein